MILMAPICNNDADDDNDALRVRTTKKQDVRTGPFTYPFASLLVPLIHSLNPDCLLCSHALLHLFIRSVTNGTVYASMS